MIVLHESYFIILVASLLCACDRELMHSLYYFAPLV